MNQHLVAAAAAVLLLGGARSAASAGAPILVRSVATNNGNLIPWSHYRLPNNVIVTFENVSSRTIKEVVFLVRDQDGIDVGHIDDKGTFSPNVAITHVFDNGYDDFAPVQVSLTPVAVTFADGEIWKAGD